MLIWSGVKSTSGNGLTVIARSASQNQLRGHEQFPSATWLQTGCGNGSCNVRRVLKVWCSPQAWGQFCFAGLSLRLIGRRSLFPQLVLLQAHQLLACFSSQYLADFRIFRKEFRVIADYSADLRRSPYVFYTMGAEHPCLLDC